MYVNPNLRGKQLADQESSVERKSPSNSTYYSRGETYFHEILLQWKTLWTKDTINTVTGELESKLNGLESVSFYSSEL